MVDQRNSTLLVLLAGILWSFSGVLIKEIHWNALSVAATRAFIGGLIQFFFLFICLKKAARGTVNEFQVTPWVVLKDIVASRSFWQWLGAISFVANMLALVFAFQLSPAANAVTLHYSGMVLVGFLSGPMLKQPPKKQDWIALIIALSGIFLLGKDGWDTHAYAGTILGLFCGLTLAMDQICQGIRVQQDSSGFGALKNVILANLLMTLIGLPAIVLSCIHGNMPPPHEWILLLILGIVPWGVPDILYALGIRHVPVFRALIIGLFDPLLTSVWPILALAEYPSKLAIFGGVIIIFAIIYQAYFEQRRLNTTVSLS